MHKADQGVPERNVLGKRIERKRAADWAVQAFESDGQSFETHLVKTGTFEEKMIDRFDCMPTWTCRGFGEAKTFFVAIKGTVTWNKLVHTDAGTKIKKGWGRADCREKEACSWTLNWRDQFFIPAPIEAIRDAVYYRSPVKTGNIGDRMGYSFW